MKDSERKQWEDWYNERTTSRASVSPANPKPSVRHEQVAAKKAEGLDRPCRVLFRSYRHRLADYDGLFGKYVLDSLVSCGVFTDDSAQYVSAVTHEQVKIPKSEQEKTEVIITEDTEMKRVLKQADSLQIGGIGREQR